MDTGAEGGALGFGGALGHSPSKLRRCNAVHKSQRKKGEQIPEDIPHLGVDHESPSKIREAGSMTMPARQGRLRRKKNEQVVVDIPRSNVDQTSQTKVVVEGPLLAKQGKDEEVPGDISRILVDSILPMKRNEDVESPLVHQHRLPRKTRVQVSEDISWLNVDQALSSGANEADPHPVAADEGRLPSEQMPEDPSSLTAAPVSSKEESEEKARHVLAQQHRLPRKAREVTKDIPRQNVDQELESQNEDGPKLLPTDQGRLPRKTRKYVPEDISRSNIDQPSLWKEDEEVPENISCLSVDRVLSKKENEGKVQPRLVHQYRQPRKKRDCALEDNQCPNVDQGSPSQVNEADFKSSLVSPGRLPRKIRAQVPEDVLHLAVDQASQTKANEEGLQPQFVEQRKMPEQVPDVSLPIVYPVPKEDEAGTQPLLGHHFRLPRKKREVTEDIPCPNADQGLETWNKEQHKLLSTDQDRLPTKMVEQVPEDVLCSHIDQTSSTKERVDDLEALIPEYERLPRKREKQKAEGTSTDLTTPREEYDGDVKSLPAVQYRLPRKKRGQVLEDLPRATVEQELSSQVNEVAQPLPADQGRLPRKMGQKVPEGIPCANIDQTLMQENEEGLLSLPAEQSKEERAPEDSPRLNVNPIPSKKENEEDVKPVLSHQYRLPRKKRVQVLQDSPPEANAADPHPVAIGEVRLPRKRGEQVPKDLRSDIDQISQTPQDGAGLKALLAEQSKLPRKKREHVHVPDDTSRLTVDSIPPRKEDVKPLPAAQFRLPRMRREQLLEDLPCSDADQGSSWSEDGPKLLPDDQPTVPTSRGEQVLEDVPLLPLSNVDQMSSTRNRRTLRRLITTQGRMPRKKGEQVPEDALHSQVYQASREENKEYPETGLTGRSSRLPRERGEQSMSDNILHSNVNPRLPRMSKREMVVG